ncbi:MAG: hypothetical protein LBG17_10135 [Bacteroidales bacterium]|jgi:hypothetical protein|nr:hypothetical protein [Bacteroidales bacterium]
MEILIKELKQNIVKLNGKYNLSDEFLDNLYSVYPFNFLKDNIVVIQAKGNYG